VGDSAKQEQEVVVGTYSARTTTTIEVDQTAVRDYIHVVDLARGHLAALLHSVWGCDDREEKKSGVCEVYNLGTGRGTSVLQLLRLVERASGTRIPYRISPRRLGDVPMAYADVGKAQRVLGWRAELTVEQAVVDAWKSHAKHGRVVV
jgi:UDP-glucose 4-epimerase